MKHTKKLLSLLLVLCLILSLSCTAFAADEAKPLTGKTVIHPNQIPVVNEMLRVSQRDYADARAILNWPRSSWPTPATTVRAPSTSASIRARTR